MNQNRESKKKIIYLFTASFALFLAFCSVKLLSHSVEFNACKEQAVFVCMLVVWIFTLRVVQRHGLHPLVHVQGGRVSGLLELLLQRRGRQNKCPWGQCLGHFCKFVHERLIRNVLPLVGGIVVNSVKT